MQQFLIDKIKSIDLFSNLSSDSLFYIYNQAKIILQKQGEVFINEGELADALYIILVGDAQVFTKNLNHEVVLARLNEGSVLGEMGYVNNYIRAASIRAIANLQLLKIDYSILDKVFHRSDIFKTLLKEKSIHKSLANLKVQLPNIHAYIEEILNSVNNNDSLFYLRIKKIFPFLFKRRSFLKHYQPGQVIFRKNEKSDYVYFVVSGSVDLQFSANAESKNVTVKKNNILGEVAVLGHKNRSATAKAREETVLLAIDGEDFKHAFQSNKNIRDLALSFKNFYKVAGENETAEQFVGQLYGHATLFTQFKMPDGRKITCFKTIDQPIFEIQVLDEKYDEELNFVFGYIKRVIYFKNGYIVGIKSIGEWDEIRFLIKILLDNVKITNYTKDNFIKFGNILNPSANALYEDISIICSCLKLSYQRIRNAISNGANNIELIAELTGGGTICGTCSPRILDIVGQSAWSYVVIKPGVIYNDKIRSFLIEPLYHKTQLFNAGQYVIIKVEIDGLWVERPYSLVSIASQNNNYEIIVECYQEGMLSQWLFENCTANSIFAMVSRPRGKFIFKTSSKRMALCIASGVGITPFIGYMRELHFKKRPGLLKIIYILKNKASVIYPEDIAMIVKNNSGYSIEIWDTSERKKFLLEDLAHAMQQTNPEHVYLCGSTNFVSVFSEYLQELKFNMNNVMTEQFVEVGQAIPKIN